jgi:hypothetical protein
MAARPTSNETNVVQRYVIEKGYVLLRKPFSIAELTLRVREALDSPLAIPAIQP